MRTPRWRAPRAIISLLAGLGLAGLPGRLLVLGTEGAITTIDADGSDPVTLAGPDPEVEERTQPTWSPDGTKVAWTERRVGRSTFLMVAEEEGQILSSVPAPLLAGCIAWGSDGTRIAMSGNDADGNLLLAAAEPDGEVEVIDQGSPLYFDWAPDGSAFAYARGTNLEDAGIWVQPVACGDPVRVASGEAAMWSPNP